MQKEKTPKHHVKGGQRSFVRISQTCPPTKTKTQGEGEISSVTGRPDVWADCSNGTRCLKTCTHKSVFSSAGATAALKKPFTLKTIEASAFASVGPAERSGHHSSNSSDSTPPGLHSLISSPLCPAHSSSSPAFPFQSPNHTLRVRRESPSANLYFQHRCASASFGISRPLLSFSGIKRVRSQSTQHAAKLQVQAQTWLALGLEDFAKVLIDSSEDEAEGSDIVKDAGSEKDTGNGRFTNTTVEEKTTPCVGTLDTDESKKMCTAPRQPIRKSKYLTAKPDAESSQQRQHSRSPCQRIRSLCASPDSPPRHFCSLWEVLEGSTLKHLVIQSKCKAFNFIHTRLASAAPSTNEEDAHVPQTRTHALRRSVQPNVLSGGQSTQGFCEECMPGKHYCTSSGGNGNEPEMNHVTFAGGSTDVEDESIGGSFSSPPNQEGPEEGGATCRAVGGTTHVFKLMVDFYLSIIYLLGDNLKRELDRRFAVEQEAHFLKAQLRRMEEQAKEGLEKAGREVEKVETQSESLIQEIATLRKKLISQERKQQDLRQQYHQKLQQQRMQHETQLEEVSLQCTSLSRENDRKERQVARLREYLQRIMQRTVETNGLAILQKRQRRSTYPANQNAPKAVFPPSLLAARNTTRTEELDTKQTQKWVLTRVPHFLGFAHSELVTQRKTVPSGSSSVLQISCLTGQNAIVKQSSRTRQIQQCCSGTREAEGAGRINKCSNGDFHNFQHRTEHGSIKAAGSCGYAPLSTSSHLKPPSKKLKKTQKRLQLLSKQQRTLLATAGVSLDVESVSRVRHGRLLISEMAFSDKTWPNTTANAHRVCARSSCESLQEELLDAVVLRKFAGDVTAVRQSRKKCIHAPRRRQRTRHSSDGQRSRTVSASLSFHIRTGMTKPEELIAAPVLTCDKVDISPMQYRRKKQPAISVRQLIVGTFLLAVLFDISMLDSHLQAAFFRTAQWTVLLALSGIQNLKRVQLPAQQEHLWQEYTDRHTIGASLLSSAVALRMRLVLLSSTEQALLLTLQALRALQKSDVEEGEHVAHYAELLTDQFAPFPANDICAKSFGINSRSDLFDACTYPLTTGRIAVHVSAVTTSEN